MNSLIRLRFDDCNIEQGNKGPILCNNIKGLSLVLYWSPGCKICKILEPQYRKLPQVINGCKICSMNINENQQIIKLSKETIAPIDFVPYIVFYVNGRPFLQYDDKADLNKIINFINYSMKLVESKKSFIDKGAKIDYDNKTDNPIPPYSIARPYLDMKCEGDFCYLTYNEAYGKPKK